MNRLTALYSPHPHNIYLDYYNRKGHKCRRHEHTTPGDHSKGYKASRGLISRDITSILFFSLFFFGGGGVEKALYLQEGGQRKGYHFYNLLEILCSTKWLAKSWAFASWCEKIKCIICIMYITHKDAVMFN